MQNMSTTQKVSFLIGILLAGVMVVSLIAPALQDNNQQNGANDPIEPTNTPAPTLPPPLTDFSGISFDEEYLHSSGLYTVALPTGWDITPEFNAGAQAQTNLNNPNLISVISAYIQEVPESVTDLDSLSAIFTPSTLQSSWARYREWRELARRVNQDDGRVDIDFQLVDNRGITFLARHAAWFDENYVYVMRVIMPENNIEALDYMFDSMIPTMQIKEQFVGSPVPWTGYFDEEDLHIIRFPNSWQITDSAPGLPASIEGLNVGLRVESSEGNIADEDAASAYITARRSDAEILSVAPVSREGADGFAVAYSYATPDGVPESGYAILLNGEDKLHIANATFEADSADLNDEETRGVYSDLATSMDTFSLMLGLNLRPEPEPEILPTPVATTAPETTSEATAEATTEATESADETPEAEETEEG